jgi:hypothetical protein
MDTNNNPFAFLDTVANWQFMQEPLWRWFVMFGAMLAIAFGWHGILEFMH